MAYQSAGIAFAGHGLWLVPHHPLRANNVDGSLWLSTPMATASGGAWLATCLVRPGTKPATGQPTLRENSASSLDVWRFDPDGPELVLFPRHGIKSFADAFEDLKSGCGASTWLLSGPSFVAGFPPGFQLSPTGDSREPFELHLLRDHSIVEDTMIRLGLASIPADQIGVRNTNLPQAEPLVESKTVTSCGRFRTWDYGYPFEGAHWQKRHVALPIKSTSTLMVSAQAKDEDATAVFAGLQHLIEHFAPTYD